VGRLNILPLFAAVPALLVLSVSSAASEPWDYRCKSALSDVESAAEDAQRAQREVEDSYERYKQTLDDYNNCRSYPQIYDLMRDRCQSQRWDVESAKSSAESDLDTFNSRMRSLADAFENATGSCGGSVARGGRAPSRTCAMIKAMRSRSTEEQVLAFCKNVGVTESECRRCMQ
jgi:uncharacterized protein (DUF885 family)